MSRVTSPKSSRWRSALVAATAAIALALGTVGLPTPASAVARADVAVVSSHPRILVTGESDFAAIRANVSTDAVSSRLQTQILNSANYQLTQPIVGYDFQDSSRMTTTAKALVDRAYTLTLAWKLTGDSKYVERLWTNLESASRFPDWNPTSFLDTAEIANAFAVAYDWAYGYWTESRRAVLRNAMLDKALRPALPLYENPPNDSQSWVVASHNRNVVVNGGLGVASLAIVSEDTSGDAQRVLDFAVASIRSGLSGYRSDGSYAEGPMYWEYATDYATTFLNALDSATGSTHGLMESGGLAESGDFIRDLMTPTGEFFTFASSDTTVYPAMGFSGLAKLTGASHLEAMSAGMDTSRRAAQRLVWRDPAVAPLSTDEQSRPRVADFSDTGIVSVRADPRDSEAAFAALRYGADATIGHRQADAGDVMIAAGGVTWAEQLGLDRTSYTALANGAPVSTRWDYYRNRIEGHNTLALDRDGTRDFRDSSGGFLTGSGTGGVGTFAIADLSATRDQSPGTWQRGIRVLSATRQIVLQDEFASAEGDTARWTLHTSAEVEILGRGDSAVMYKDGQRLHLQLAAPDGARFWASPAVPSPLSPNVPQDANSGFTKLVVDLSGGPSQRLTVTMTLLSATGDAPALAAPVLALSDWGSHPEQGPRLSQLTVDGAQVTGFDPERRSYTIPRDPALPQPAIFARDQAGNTLVVSQAADSPGSYTIGASSESGLDSGVLVTFVPEQTAILSAVASATTRGSAGAVFDGNESSGWATTGLQTLDLTLRGAVDLHRLDVLWTANNSRRIDYRILVPTSGGWSPIATSSHRSASGWSSNAFNTASRTSRVRIEVAGDPGGDRTSTIREISVYGYRGAPVPSGLAPSSWMVRSADTPSRLAVDEWAPLTMTASGAAAGAAFERVTNNRSVVGVFEHGIVGVSPGSANVGAYARVGNWEFPSTTSAVTVEASQHLSVAPSADTFVEGGASQNRNFGAATRLDVKAASPSTPADGTRVRTSLLAFDLSAIDSHRVASAVLVLTGSIADNAAGTAVRVDAYEVEGGWSGSSVTYASRPALGAPIGSTVVTRDVAESRLDLTSLVRESAPSELATLDIALGGTVAEDPTLMARFGSLESATPPRIEIVLEPVALPIRSAAASGTLRGTPANTYDGSVSTGWAGRGGASVTYTLESETLLRTVSSDWSPDSSREVSFQVSTSLDGTRWVDAGSFVHSGPAGRSTHALHHSFRAKYVRLQLVSGSSAWQATLREISFISPGSAAADTPGPVVADWKAVAPAAMSAGQAGTVMVTAADLRGEPVEDVRVTHTSDAPSIVSVDESGRLAARAPGSAIVTTLVEQGPLSRSFRNVITVTDPAVMSITARADTFVEGGSSSTTVFGQRTRLDVKPLSPASPGDGTRVRHAYLDFDLSGVTPSSVRSAKLLLHGALIDDPSRPEARVNVYEVTGSWDEGTTTYSTRPALGRIIASFTVTRTAGAREIDLTTYVRQLSSDRLGRVAIGLGGEVTTNAESLMTRFDSREAGAATAPKLIIERAVSGIPVASASASATLRGTPAATIDGNETTGWAANGDQNITWGLASEAHVGSIRLLWTANASRYVKYELVSSLDGKQWRTIHDGEYRGTSGWQSIFLPKGERVSMLRLVVHGDPRGDRQSVLREAVILAEATVTG